MDEASSKFVDKLVLEKLMEEKLSKTSHRPSFPPEALLDDAFFAYARPPGAPDIIRRVPERDVVFFRSPAETFYLENRTFPVYRFPAAPSLGNILLVHGLYEDNRGIYGFFIGELNRLGYTVYMTTLPYHHERVPAQSRYSGEFFLSADLARTKRAFIQAVAELRLCHDWLSATSGAAPIVVGFSMGGTVALAATLASPKMKKVCSVNPAAHLAEVIETSPLCATVRSDLAAAAWSSADIQNVVNTFDPYTMHFRLKDGERILLIYGLYDQITRPRQYEALVKKWRLPNVLTYKAGHLNTLRVPRFAADTVRFAENEGTAGPFVSRRML
jgi:alpha-beta hydrolase superfamily lysophospholipase